MNTDELNAAAQKLIEEANTESAAALASYEEDCLRMRFACWNGAPTARAILSDALHELRADYDAQVLRIQKELDESLEALYAEAQEPEEPGGEETGRGRAGRRRAGRRGTGRRRAGRRGTGRGRAGRRRAGRRGTGRGRAGRRRADAPYEVDGSLPMRDR